MKIKSVEFRNFASYGNKLQKLEFEEDTGNFYLILGPNGSGKSTLSDVIKFALYGKLQNKNLKDIPNRFNSNTWCKITLEKDSQTQIVIERGLNPTMLKCTINGQIYDQAGKRNVQNFIEEKVIGLPFYVFNNIISLSINDFKSFLNMSPHDKRLIIDKVFSLEIINRMRSYVKEESRKIRDVILLLDNETQVLEKSISSSKNELEKLLQKIQSSNISLKAQLEEKIHKFKQQIITLETKDKEIKAKEEILQNKYTQLQTAKTNLNLVVRQANEKEKLYENEKCPTCGGNLHTHEHKLILENWLNRRNCAIQEIDKLDKEFVKLSEISNKLKSIRQKLVEQRTKIQTHLEFNQNELFRLEAPIDPLQTESLKNIIFESQKKKETVKNNKINIEKKGNFYKILEEIFGDRGVKQLAIQRILPSLNAEINRVIKELNLEYRVVFNDEFDAKIMHLGYPVSSQMLSTGERKKIDFAVLVSLIRMMKLKFHGLNLIFLDEIFSSVDSDGIYQILKILSNMCKELNINIFVINHSPLPIEIFDYRINIFKNDGFSNFEIEKI